MARSVLHALAAAALAARGSVRALQPAQLSLDGTTALHAYEGHGALSAGASSRLLWDYPEPQRSQILDYLFLPNFGAGLHTLKVEIGGDAQSTDGTEPSHMHTRGDLSCTRGYELWLIQQAKVRNPDVLLYGLSWGVPSWVGNGTYYSLDNVAYQVSWMTCIAQQSGFSLNAMGAWNERPQPSADYVLQLRAAMDAQGFADTKIILMDGGLDEGEVTLAQGNATYAAAVFGAGLHYPCNRPAPEVRELGWTFWASEDYSRDPAWSNGGTYWSKALSQNYVLMNMTSTISWSLIWSAYTNLVCNGAGLMRAHEPWTGNYEVSAPIWLSAHWTQFVQPGWRFLHVPGGGSGFLTLPNGATGGTYVTLVPPKDLSGLTVIIETMENNDCVIRNYTDWALTFQVSGGLPGAGTVLHVWKTVSSAYFVQQPDVTITPGGTFSITVEADSVYTLSTTAGARHGSFPGDIPASAPWALPYNDTFDTYPYDAMAKYWSDQGGSWAARNGTLTQVGMADPGANAWAANPDPLTQIGDPSWADVAITVDVTFSADRPDGTGSAPVTVRPTAALPTPRRSAERLQQWRQGYGLPRLSDAELSPNPRLSAAAPYMLPCDPTDPGQVWQFDNPSPQYLRNFAPGGGGSGICLNVGGCDPSSIMMYECVNDPGSSSCGAPNGQYPNLMWALNPSTGALTSPEPTSPGWALTMFPGNQSLYLTASFTGAATQVWAFNSTSGALSLPGLGLCMTGEPAKRTYAQVCTRITSFDGFNAQAAMDGYCLQVDHVGAWHVVSAGVVLSNGTLPTPFDPTVSHTLGVSAAGSVITGSVDGQQVTQVVDGTYAYGNLALGSGWHQARFDNFLVTSA